MTKKNNKMTVSEQPGYISAEENTVQDGDAKKVSSDNFPMICSDSKSGNGFDTEKPVVLLKSTPCPVTEEFKNVVNSALSKHFDEKITPMCNAVAAVKRVINQICAEKNGWIPMRDGTWYFSAIDAIIYTAKQTTMIGNGWLQDLSPFKVDSSFNDYAGCIPDYGEVCRMNTRFTPVLGDIYFLACLIGYDWGANIQYENSVPQLKSEYLAIYEKCHSNDKVAFLNCKQCYGVKRDGNRLDCDVYNLPIFRFHKGVLEKGLSSSQVFCQFCLFDLEPILFSDIQYEDEFNSQTNGFKDSTFPEDKCASMLSAVGFKDWTAACQWTRLFDWAKMLFRAQPELFDPDCDSFLSIELCKKAFEAGKTVFGMNKAAMESEVLQGKSSICDEAISSFLQKKLLESDFRRGNISPMYDEGVLTTANSGHWDIWEKNAIMPDLASVEVPCRFYARNPVCDIHSGATVGIDFGTKSTVVVRRVARQELEPMRIGTGDFNKLSSREDYENPTIMQLINWDSFRKAYIQREGRPETLWDDLIISHAAGEARKSCASGNEFPTYFADMKQWAGGSDYTLQLWDKNSVLKANAKGEKTPDNIIHLPPFRDLTEEDMNPLEIYAYNIGLQINNMKQGIHLHYELSYPVTYDRDNLERLRSCFERGLRKSLPQSILDNEEIMQDFYVRFGASEPAAYSLCALQEFGFEPESGEYVHYGVFDFGGGTTDFDFGIFRGANEEEEDSGKDFVLEHFRPSGDRYLGGENILQMLAFHVFRKNRGILLEKGIQFSRPYDKEGTVFDGHEELVNDMSSEAMLNMQSLMGCLRPLWENPADAEKNFTRGEIALNLFKKDGSQETNVTLALDREELLGLVKNRILQGVKNFFIRLEEAFSTSNIKEKIDKIYILLAGNSCKSHFVKEVFLEQISELKSRKDSKLSSMKFQLLPLLGSQEADAFIRNRKNPVPLTLEQLDMMMGIIYEYFDIGLDADDFAELSQQDALEKLHGILQENKDIPQEQSCALLEEIKHIFDKQNTEETVSSDKDESRFFSPTGKTGVAFGLVMGRSGGNVLVIDKNMDKEGDISFRYYVGRAKRRMLKSVLDGTVEKMSWQRVMKIGDDANVELYFTDMPEGGTGEMPVSRANCLSIGVRQPAMAGQELFIRISGADEIQYAIAGSENNINKDDIKTQRLS